MKIKVIIEEELGLIDKKIKVEKVKERIKEKKVRQI